MASFVRPLWTQKCRLASPSVTNERWEWPSSLSGINPARTAAVRIMLCWAPSHPFGWVRTNSVWSSKVSHIRTPLACVSCMKVRAHWWRYRRKSAKTSIADFPRGRSGILFVTWPLDWALGRRWSLNLNFQSATPMGREGRCNALPFCFCPLTVFGIIFDALAKCLSTDRANVSILIIVNDGWDLAISANIFLVRITRTLMSGYDRLWYNFRNLLPSYSQDFRNFAWIENTTQEVRYRFQGNYYN